MEVVSKEEVLKYINRLVNSGLGKNKCLEYLGVYVDQMNTYTLDAGMLINPNPVEEVKNNLTIREIAQIIWNMDYREQSDLLDELASIDDPDKIYNQMLDIRNEIEIEDDKRKRMRIKRFVSDLYAYICED